MTEELTEKQAEEMLRQFSEQKANQHTFFTNVIKTDKTLKTGNLDKDELGEPFLPVRTFQELALISQDVLDQPLWADVFQGMSEIQTSSSLSKEGFLLRLSVTSKKELADVSPKGKKKNKGWFKSKKNKDEPTALG